MRERDTELTGRLRTQKVIKFLINCGNKNLQYLLVPARLEARRDQQVLEVFIAAVDEEFYHFLCAQTTREFRVSLAHAIRRGSALKAINGAGRKPGST